MGNTNTYFKLATLDPRLFTFKDGKEGFASEAEAKAAARYDGTYRVSEVTDAGRRDLEPFEVTGKGAAPAAKKPLKGGLRKFAAPWNTHGTR